MIRALIFDCFGVIRHDNIRPAYRHFGGDVEKDNQFIIDTVAAANRGMIPNSGVVFAEKLGVSHAEWERVCHEIGALDQELLDHILGLRARYKIGLLSNVSRGGLQRWFTPEELTRYFDYAIGSGDVGHVKPEPAIYELTAERLGVEPSQCVMIDDRQTFCDGAVAAGMQAIQYVDLPQLKRELELLLVADSSQSER